MVGARLKTALDSAAVRKLLYRSGALDRFHRVRNRRALTVVAFDRIIPPTDPRFATCDPEHTLPAPLFEACLGFLRNHYNPVSMDQVAAAADGRGRLPERALLVTFDGGWADNHEYATGALAAAGLSAVVFVASDAVDRAQPFWPEQLVSAWRRGALTADDCRALWKGAGGDPIKAPPFGIDRDDLGPVRGLVARLELCDAGEREALLAPLAERLDDKSRHMVTAADLAAMAAGPFTVGAHGRTRASLLRAGDPDAELVASRAALREHLGAPPIAMSFPHGSHSPALIDAAHRAGYHLVFTRALGLLSTEGRLPSCLPRIAVTAGAITDRDGAFAPWELAALLFRRPIAAPAS